MNGRRVIDWRLIAVFCVMIAVVLAGYAFVQRVNQTDDLIAIAKSSERNANRTADEFAAFRAASEKRSAQASRERDLLLEQNKVQLHQNRLLQHQLTVLAKFLRSKGFDVPKSVVLRSSRPSSSTKSPPKAPARRPPASRDPHPGTPSPSTSPAPVCALVPDLCTGLPLGLPTLLPQGGTR